MLDRVLNLKNVFFLNFSFLFGYALIVNREGLFVPSYTESHYLLHLAKLWNPNFLANDWTFSSLPSHFVFNVFFGPLTLLFPLEVVGWIGRILAWVLILLGLFYVGKHFDIPLWMITVAILFWLLYRQSIVGGEWVLATFEAKSIAYALLFFSLNGFMHDRGIIIPSILLGLAFSFHPLVGLWGVLSVGLSLIVLRYPIDAIVKFGCYTGLFALPGLIPLLTTTFEGGREALEAVRFVSLAVMPYHLDPFYFGRTGAGLLAIMLCFNWLHWRLSGKSHALDFLISFQMFLGLFFVLGFVWRYMENYNLLLLMPCRLFPVLLPLFFCLHLMSALQDCHAIRYGRGLVVLGFFAVASFGNPVDVFVYSMKKNYKIWTQEEEDVQKAFRWIAKNTPSNAVVISPPWRVDSFYLSRRGQIAAWWVPRFDRLGEWRERLESLVGDVSGVRGHPGNKARSAYMASHYNALTATDIKSLGEKYRAEYLVSSARYSFPVLFHSGGYKVYSLKRDGRPVGQGQKGFGHRLWPLGIVARIQSSGVLREKSSGIPSGPTVNRDAVWTPALPFTNSPSQLKRPSGRACA